MVTDPKNESAAVWRKHLTLTGKESRHGSSILYLVGIEYKKPFKSPFELY